MCPSFACIFPPFSYNVPLFFPMFPTVTFHSPIIFPSSKEVYLANFRVTDDGHGSHHHVNHTIMSTLSSSSWVVKGWGKTFSGAKPCGFTGMVAPGVAKVGFVFLRFWALLIHWFIALFKYRFIGSLVRCFVDSLCGSWIHVYYLHMDSLSHWFIDSLVTSFLGSFSQLYVDFFFRVVSVASPQPAICSFVDAFHNFNTYAVAASQNLKLSYRPLISYSVVFFFKLPARHGWAVSGISVGISGILPLLSKDFPMFYNDFPIIFS